MVSLYARLQRARRKRDAAQEKVTRINKQLKKARQAYNKRKRYANKIAKKVQKHNKPPYTNF